MTPAEKFYKEHEDEIEEKIATATNRDIYELGFLDGYNQGEKVGEIREKRRTAESNR